jgi:hypothetical protein
MVEVNIKLVLITLPKLDLLTDFEITRPSLQQKLSLLGGLFIDHADF